MSVCDVVEGRDDHPPMGTSVEMVDRTYGHLAQGAEQSAREKLDAAYARRFGQEMATAEGGEDG